MNRSDIAQAIANLYAGLPTNDNGDPMNEPNAMAAIGDLESRLFKLDHPGYVAPTYENDGQGYENIDDPTDPTGAGRMPINGNWGSTQDSLGRVLGPIATMLGQFLPTPVGMALSGGLTLAGHGTEALPAPADDNKTPGTWGGAGTIDPETGEVTMTDSGAMPGRDFSYGGSSYSGSNAGPIAAALTGQTAKNSTVSTGASPVGATAPLNTPAKDDEGLYPGQKGPHDVPSSGNNWFGFGSLQAALDAGVYPTDDEEFAQIIAAHPATAGSPGAQHQIDAGDPAAIAAKQAEEARKLEEKRQADIKTGEGSIASAFSSFTPEYYSGLEKAYTDTLLPDINDQYKTARDKVTYSLARGGNLESSTAADSFKRLLQQNLTTEQNVRSDAHGRALQAQSNTESQRQNLLSINRAAADPGTIAPQAVAAAGSLQVPQPLPNVSGVFSDLLSDLVRTGGTAAILNSQGYPLFGNNRSGGGVGGSRTSVREVRS